VDEDADLFGQAVNLDDMFAGRYSRVRESRAAGLPVRPGYAVNRCRRYRSNGSSRRTHGGRGPYRGGSKRARCILRTLRGRPRPPAIADTLNPRREDQIS
jgi:hypothetical protein